MDAARQYGVRKDKYDQLAEDYYNRESSQSEEDDEELLFQEVYMQQVMSAKRFDERTEPSVGLSNTCNIKNCSKNSVCIHILICRF